ncbi:citryl-CoA lyase [Orrella sp. 11846]|uniref:citryl-CoA lyase n=1 Tax=Orrella sp. 11846 TaxID=3409913 RepID=UPI003B593C3A
MQQHSDRQLAEDWWRTRIIRMQPDQIEFHGHPIESLIGQLSFTGMIWLMLRGEQPTAVQEALLSAALMAGVDHGPQAPSIAIARMAITCGVGINNAMASAANVLGDVHGGAGEQCLEFYDSIQASLAESGNLNESIDQQLQQFFASGKKFVPGFGHRFHRQDPRVKPLMSLLDEAEATGEVKLGYAAIARGVQEALTAQKKRPITMNVDGATAAIYGALGFEPALCRGLFVLSRSVGILAHANEQRLQGERNKGPIPKGWLWTYDGKPSQRNEDSSD